jgi:hypothetical protein
MYLTPGTDVMVTLRDGTTLAGKAKFVWRWWLVRLEAVVVHTEHGPVQGAGDFVIPRHSIHYLQIGV